MAVWPVSAAPPPLLCRLSIQGAVPERLMPPFVHDEPKVMAREESTEPSSHATGRGYMGAMPRVPPRDVPPSIYSCISPHWNKT